MRTYYIFNVNRYFAFMYKNNPFKMYKLFEEIYNTKDYDKTKAFYILEQIANCFNKDMLNEYIFFELKYKYGYIRDNNIHIIKGKENTYVRINNYNIKIETDTNYTIFFNYLKNYNTNLFICDFANKDYFWLNKLEVKSLQNT